MKWDFEDPALTLQEYYNENKEYQKEKDIVADLKNNLKSEKNKLDKSIEELNKIDSQLAEESNFKEIDATDAVSKLYDEKAIELNNNKKVYESKKAELLAIKESGLAEAEQYLQNSLNNLKNEGFDYSRKLSIAEEKALEFEKSRRDYNNNSDTKIKEYQNSISNENLEHEVKISELKKKQDEVREKYEPDIAHYQTCINEINSSYEPTIQQCQSVVKSKVALRNEEINKLNADKKKEISITDKELAEYKKEYKQTERQFNEQILTAKSQKRPTTQMENSKTSRLNSIKDKQSKAKLQLDRKIAKIDKDIETVNSKYEKIINKAETELNRVIDERDAELKKPKSEYDYYVTHRDEQIEDIQKEIDFFEQDHKAEINKFNSLISKEQKNQENHNKEIDDSILEFVMAGDTCLSEVEDEVHKPFIELQSRVEVWKQLLSTILRDKSEQKYIEEYSKKKELFDNMDFNSLMTEVSKAKVFNDTLSSILKNNGVCLLISGIVIVISLILLLLLYFGFNISGALSLGIVCLGALVFGFYVFKQTKSTFSSICGYIVLASEYKNFSSVSNHAVQVTQSRELAAMKELGSTLYEQFNGKDAIYKSYEERKDNVESTYMTAMSQCEFDYTMDEMDIVSKYDEEINAIKKNVTERNANHASQLSDLEKKSTDIKEEINVLQSNIQKIEADIVASERFIENFEQNYGLLTQELNNEKWVTPMKSTRGKLNESLYIIPESGETDKYNHKKIYEINHKKKPVVILYDIDNISEGEGSRQEEIGKIIKNILLDLMYAVYRMNSKEIYSQVIIDETGGSDLFKATAIKNTFNISEIASDINSVKNRLKALMCQREALAEKGITIDDLNEQKFTTQERPEIYNIFYLVFKPGEKRMRLDEDMKKLIPECNKYGFLPFFICEKETWENGYIISNTMFNDINSMLSNEVIVYDGKNYN